MCSAEAKVGPAPLPVRLGGRVPSPTRITRNVSRGRRPVHLQALPVAPVVVAHPLLPALRRRVPQLCRLVTLSSALW